jgi:hypothetical protein
MVEVRIYKVVPNVAPSPSTVASVAVTVPRYAPQQWPPYRATVLGRQDLGERQLTPSS